MELGLSLIPDLTGPRCSPELMGEDRELSPPPWSRCLRGELQALRRHRLDRAAASLGWRRPSLWPSSQSLGVTALKGVDGGTWCEQWGEEAWADDPRKRAVSHSASLQSQAQVPSSRNLPWTPQLDSPSSKLTVSLAIATCLTRVGVQSVAKAWVGIASSFSHGLRAGAEGTCAGKTLGPGPGLEQPGLSVPDTDRLD